jgi:uncharacterized protein with von Willebrand factor type A (vWA) domain
MGQEFVSHRSLYDSPDPRRLDLRASLRASLSDGRSEWLVRVNRQRSSVRVHVIVDVSTSMGVGLQRRKLDVAADFVEALGQSAFRIGDTLGMFAFDAHARTDLFVPTMFSRGMGSVMATILTNCSAVVPGSDGLDEVALHLSGRHGLVFLISDFHWSLDRLGSVLDRLASSLVVPLVIWDSSELRPPAKDAVMSLQDTESGAHRTLWVRPRLRTRWAEAVEQRRTDLGAVCSLRGIRPFHICDRFDADAMSRYFFEGIA